MRNLYISLINFINSLSILDVIFMGSVIFLIILIILLIYVTRMDEEENLEIMKNSNESQEMGKDNEELDLALISQELEEASPPNISLTPYEEEQEERAIISYDELISNTGKVKLNYEDEQEDDGLVVKKVDLDNLNTPDLDMPKLANNNFKDELMAKSVISYAKEEDFLAALKKMQKSLY